MVTEEIPGMCSETVLRLLGRDVMDNTLKYIPYSDTDSFFIVFAESFMRYLYRLVLQSNFPYEVSEDLESIFYVTTEGYLLNNAISNTVNVEQDPLVWAKALLSKEDPLLIVRVRDRVIRQRSDILSEIRITNDWIQSSPRSSYSPPWEISRSYETDPISMYSTRCSAYPIFRRDFISGPLKVCFESTAEYFDKPNTKVKAILKDCNLQYRSLNAHRFLVYPYALRAIAGEYYSSEIPLIHLPLHFEKLKKALKIFPKELLHLLIWYHKKIITTYTSEDHKYCVTHFPYLSEIVLAKKTENEKISIVKAIVMYEIKKRSIVTTDAGVRERHVPIPLPHTAEYYYNLPFFASMFGTTKKEVEDRLILKQDLFKENIIRVCRNNIQMLSDALQK